MRWIMVWLGSLMLPALVQAQTVSAIVEWQVADAVSSVVIERSISTSGLFGVFTKIAELPPGTQTYTDATVLEGQTVCYRVAHKNTVGLSPYAGPVCKTFVKAKPTQLIVK